MPHGDPVPVKPQHYRCLQFVAHSLRRRLPGTNLVPPFYTDTRGKTGGPFSCVQSGHRLRLPFGNLALLGERSVAPLLWLVPMLALTAKTV